MKIFQFHWAILTRAIAKQAKQYTIGISQYLLFIFLAKKIKTSQKHLLNAKKITNF